ncbi:MAG: sensor histidine kinase [Oscillospiraceae bacterium]|nr:sensor histidine kinase [Oscillospiraceae bacterium]
MFNPIQKILNTKFRNKLILMCIAAVVPMVMAGIYLLYNIVDVMRSNAANEAIFQADGLKTKLKDTVVTVSNISGRITSSESLEELLNGDSENIGFLQERLISEYLDVYPQIDSVTLYLNDEGIDYPVPTEEDTENEMTESSESVSDDEPAENKSGSISSFRFADDDILSKYWYKEAEENLNNRWQIILNDNDEYRLSLVTPLLSGDRFCGAMVISVDTDWISDMTEDIGRGVVMCASKGYTFYSSVDGTEAGTVIGAGDEIPIGVSDSQVLTDGKNQLERKGYTVVSYFNYENTYNRFYVYVVKPRAIYNDSVNNVVASYVWYVCLCITLSVLITILFSSMFSRRIQSLQDKMHSVADGNFELTDDIKGNDEIYDLYEDLKKMVDSMQNLINAAYKAKIQSESFKLNQVEAEFKALASQINPHFLYNTLETIRMKAYCNNDKETADLVKKLGKFMRRCLEVKDGMVTLESELEFTKSYLELQAARFGDRVSYSIYCEVDKKYMVLPLIIQPIVENAFVHGIEGEKANGRITVKVMYKGKNVEICVSDNGQGISKAKLAELLEKLERNDTSSGKSIGLTNVNKRIKMYHGEQYGLSVKTAEGKGTDISIILPRIVDENVMKRLPEKYSEISAKLSGERPAAGVTPKFK